MTILEWAVQALLVLALGACLPVALRLERTLSALGRDRADLAASAKVFTEAVQEAEAAITKLRQASERAGRGIAEQVAAAERVGEDLRFLVQRSEAQADRLDAAVRSVRAFAAGQRLEPEQAGQPVPAATAGPAAAGERPPADPPAAPGGATVPSRAQAEQDVLRMFRAARAS
jgi:hypothetical protein